MISFYAFCRVADDIADSGSLSEEEKERQLSHWKKCVLACEAPGHSVLDEVIELPGYTREDYERAFAEYLGISKTIWLGEGCVGDDTHGHIDDIARFIAPGMVLLAHEEDERDENHSRSLDNLHRLQRATDARGEEFHGGAESVHRADDFLHVDGRAFAAEDGHAGISADVGDAFHAQVTSGWRTSAASRRAA